MQLTYVAQVTGRTCTVAQVFFTIPRHRVTPESRLNLFTRQAEQQHFISVTDIERFLYIKMGCHYLPMVVGRREAGMVLFGWNLKTHCNVSVLSQFQFRFGKRCNRSTLTKSPSKSSRVRPFIQLPDQLFSIAITQRRATLSPGHQLEVFEAIPTDTARNGNIVALGSLHGRKSFGLVNFGGI